MYSVFDGDTCLCVYRQNKTDVLVISEVVGVREQITGISLVLTSSQRPSGHRLAFLTSRPPLPLATSPHTWAQSKHVRIATPTRTMNAPFCLEEFLWFAWPAFLTPTCFCLSPFGCRPPVFHTGARPLVQVGRVSRSWERFLKLEAQNR